MLVCRRLEAAGFVNGFSTRCGGVSPFPDGDLNLAGFDEDLRENIAENRRRFLSALEAELPIATGWQIHGDTINIVDSRDEAIDSTNKADALVSNVSGVLLGVKTADCVPILLGDRNTNSFAAAHAGWRGTSLYIVKKAVSRMKELFGTEPSDLIAAIGPAACGRDYEIGREVMKAFAHLDDSEKYFRSTREGHALVDLHAVNRDQLVEAGIGPDNIFIAPYCTMERTDLFFSYRREKMEYGRTGRLLSVIGRR